MRPRTRKTALLGVVTLAVLLATVLHAAAPARTVKIAVLTLGLSFGEVLAGFRDGLSQLAYREQEGQGATFYFTVPCARPGSSATTQG